jgi:hypothetical protein
MHLQAPFTSPVPRCSTCPSCQAHRLPHYQLYRSPVRDVRARGYSPYMIPRGSPPPRERLLPVNASSSAHAPVGNSETRQRVYVPALLFFLSHPSINSVSRHIASRLKIEIVKAERRAEMVSSVTIAEALAHGKRLQVINLRACTGISIPR